MTQPLQESLQKIIQGVNQFQQKVYPGKQARFHSLAKAQHPKILFITCSDSRIDPALITQTEPGDMFLIQNAGNIVPPYGSAYGGTGASIEYAVAALNVEHVIICGHSACGAMGALLNKSAIDHLPTVKHWLSMAETTRILMEVQTQGLNDQERVDACIKLNIPVQLSHLKTLPSVAAKIQKNEIQLHGWVYHIDSGEIDVYQEEGNQFIPFQEAYPLPAAVK